MLSFTEISNSEREGSNLEKIMTSVLDTSGVKSCETSKWTSRLGS